MKQIKLGTRITLVMILVLAIGLTSLWLITNMRTTADLKTSAINTLTDAVNTRTELIELYIQEGETLLRGYGRADDIVKALLLDPENEELQAKAQEYTMGYGKGKANLASIYIAMTTTEILAHTNPGSIGVITRTGERAEALANAVFRTGDLYNGGVMISPTSGLQIVTMYYPIYDDNGGRLGWVGASTFISFLKEKLDSLKIVGLEDSEYALINVKTGEYIFHNDDELIATVTEDASHLEIIENVKNNPTKGISTMEFKDAQGENSIKVYKNMVDRDWVFILSEKESSVYADAARSSEVLAVACIIVLVLTAAIIWLLISFMTRGLGRVSDSLEKIGRLDLTEDEVLKSYLQNRSEVGIIASATDNVSHTVKNIIETLNTCDIEMVDNMEYLNKASNTLTNYVRDNASATEEFSSRIETTNTAINEVKDEVVNISNIVTSIGGKVGDSTTISDELIKTSREMEDSIEVALKKGKKLK